MENTKKLIWKKKESRDGLTWIELKNKHVKIYYTKIETSSTGTYYIKEALNLNAILWQEYNEIRE